MVIKIDDNNHFFVLKFFYMIKHKKYSKFFVCFCFFLTLHQFQLKIDRKFFSIRCVILTDCEFSIVIVLVYKKFTIEKRLFCRQCFKMWSEWERNLKFRSLINLIIKQLFTENKFFGSETLGIMQVVKFVDFCSYSKSKKFLNESFNNFQKSKKFEFIKPSGLAEIK